MLESIISAQNSEILVTVATKAVFASLNITAHFKYAQPLK